MAKQRRRTTFFGRLQTRLNMLFGQTRRFEVADMRADIRENRRRKEKRKAKREKERAQRKRNRRAARVERKRRREYPKAFRKAEAAGVLPPAPRSTSAEEQLMAMDYLSRRMQKLKEEKENQTENSDPYYYRSGGLVQGPNGVHHRRGTRARKPKRRT